MQDKVSKEHFYEIKKENILNLSFTTHGILNPRLHHVELLGISSIKHWKTIGIPNQNFINLS